MPAPLFVDLPSLQYYRAASGDLGDAGVETQVQELLAAFLRDYFDGAAHSVGGVSMVFPAIAAEDYSWDTDEPREPAADAAQIHAVIGEIRANEALHYGNDQRLVEDPMTVTWRCRVPNAGDPNYQGKRLARTVASRLAALMERGSAPAATLGGKGVSRSHVLRLPVNVPFSGYWIYQVITQHTLRYTRQITIKP